MNILDYFDINFQDGFSGIRIQNSLIHLYNETHSLRKKIIKTTTYIDSIHK